RLSGNQATDSKNVASPPAVILFGSSPRGPITQISRLSSGPPVRKAISEPSGETESTTASSRSGLAAPLRTETSQALLDWPAGVDLMERAAKRAPSGNHAIGIHKSAADNVFGLGNVRVSPVAIRRR